eukprot:6479265-Amphidinium_carterae.2
MMLFAWPKLLRPNSSMSSSVSALVANASVQTVELPQQISCIADLVVRAPAAVYVVWRLEGTDHPVPNVHFGPCAWQGITSLIPEIVHRVGADRLRRVRDGDECANLLHAGQALYLSEASKHLVPASCTYWYWGAELEDKLPSRPVRRLRVRVSGSRSS